MDIHRYRHGPTKAGTRRSGTPGAAPRTRPPAPADVGLVTVELEPVGDAATELRLEHEAAVDDDLWDAYGPGATGVGWDLALLGLALFLRGGAVSDPRASEASPEARAFAARSSREWGAAHEASGATPAQARDAAARPADFCAPDPQGART